MLWEKLNTVLLLVTALSLFCKGSGFNFKSNTSLSFDVSYYSLDLAVNDTNTIIKGSADIHLTITRPEVHKLKLELSNNLLIDSVFENNIKVNYYHSNDTLSIENIDSENTRKIISVFYGGDGSFSSRGVQHRYIENWKQHITWTLSEPFYAKYWFPVKQDLNDKADSVRVALIVDSGLTAVSNGTLVSSTLLPGKKIKYTWKSNYPINYYLISFAVSKYYKYEFYAPVNQNDSVLVSNYVYNAPSYLSENIDEIKRTNELMLLFSGLFGDYPFKNEKYGHAVAPIGGGMEHQTITTISDFRFFLIAHELAHQWFGNYVTCSDWKDIWINEGFASYAEYLAFEYLESKEKADEWLKEAINEVLAENSGSIYINEDEVSETRIFDYRLSYKKGAVFIHMLRKRLNDDTVFFNILKSFLGEFSYKSASTEDFKRVAENISGISFDDFFDSWLYGEGFPELEINWQQTNGILNITSNQVQPVNNLFDFELTFYVDFFEIPGTNVNVKINNFENIESFNNTDDLVFKLVPNPDRLTLVKIKSMHRMPISYYNDSISIISNPDLDYLKILFYEPGSYEISLYNITGQRIFHQSEVTNNSITIPVNIFSSGIKILRITSYKGDILKTKTVLIN